MIEKEIYRKPYLREFPVLICQNTSAQLSVSGSFEEIDFEDIDAVAP